MSTSDLRYQGSHSGISKRTLSGFYSVLRGARAPGGLLRSKCQPASRGELLEISINSMGLAVRPDPPPPAFCARASAAGISCRPAPPTVEAELAHQLVVEQVLVRAVLVH